MDRNDGSLTLVGLPKMYVHTRNKNKTGLMLTGVCKKCVSRWL